MRGFVSLEQSFHVRDTGACSTRVSVRTSSFIVRCPPARSFFPLRHKHVTCFGQTRAKARARQLRMLPRERFLLYAVLKRASIRIPVQYL